MHRRSPRSTLNPSHCKALQHAWIEAASQGYPLNAFITIRNPGEPLNPQENANRVAVFWNRLAVWSRRHTAEQTFHCIVTREAAPNGKRIGTGEHFHALLHVPHRQFEALMEATARWYPAPGEAVVKPARQTVSRSEGGKIRSALGYITKQRTPQAAWATDYSRKPGGIVLGKRYRITANLRPKPIDVALPRPLHRVA